MKISFLFAVAISLLLSGVSAGAVTLPECIERALARSPLIQAGEALVQASSAAYNRDQGALFPQLSLAGTQDFRTGGVSILSIKVAEDFQKILVNFPESSRLALEKSRWTKLEAQQDLKKAVTLAYYQLILLLQKQKDHRFARRYFENHIHDIEKLETAGVDVQLDLERARIRYALVMTALNTSDSQVQNQLIELNGLTASGFSEKDFEAGSDEAVRTDPDWLNHVEKEVADRMPGTLRYRLDKAEVDIAAADYGQSQYSFLPALGLDFERGRPADDPTINANFVTLDWTFWDWGQKVHDGRRLRSEAEAKQKTFEGNQRTFEVALRRLIQDLKSDQANYALARENTVRAERLTKLSQHAYRQGKIKETDLLDIASSYLESRQQLYDVLADYYTKKAELDYSLAGIRP